MASGGRTIGIVAGCHEAGEGRSPFAVCSICVVFIAEQNPTTIRPITCWPLVVSGAKALSFVEAHGKIAMEKPVWPHGKPIPSFKSYAEEVKFWHAYDFESDQSEEGWEEVPCTTTRDDEAPKRTTARVGSALSAWRSVHDEVPTARSVNLRDLVLSQPVVHRRSSLLHGDEERADRLARAKVEDLDDLGQAEPAAAVPERERREEHDPLTTGERPAIGLEQLDGARGRTAIRPEALEASFRHQGPTRAGGLLVVAEHGP